MQAIRSSTGQRAAHIAHAVSDAFVVATQRVKQAQKSSIPHMEEHVSKLDFVGVQTQLKLQDIKGAAAASGVVGLSVIHNNITTGESALRQCHLWCRRGVVTAACKRNVCLWACADKAQGQYVCVHPICRCCCLSLPDVVASSG